MDDTDTPVTPQGTPSVDKALVKEALTEILQEIPAFRAFASGSTPPLWVSGDTSSAQLAAGGSRDPPTPKTPPATTGEDNQKIIKIDI